MPLDTGLNHDERGKDQRYIARGQRSLSISLTVSDTIDNGSANFTASGKLYGLLIDEFDVTGAVSTITTIEIFPQDATNAEARVVNITGLTLAESTVHFVDVPQNHPNTLTPVMFGQMTIKITLSAAPSGADASFTIIPILGKH